MINVKAVVAAFNQEKALVGAFSVITNLRMELFEALVSAVSACSIHREVAILMSMAACVTTPPSRRDAESAKYIGIN